MKKYFLLFTTIFLIVIGTNSCKKSQRTEPPDCHLLFSLRYLDDKTGEDLGLRNDSILDSIKITQYIERSETETNIGASIYVNNKYTDTSVNYEFIANPIDFCKEILYSNLFKVKYIITYADNVKSDSIVLSIGKINTDYITTYSINDSLISSININDFTSTGKEIPTIIIKK